jgi:hypothetical protein
MTFRPDFWVAVATAAPVIALASVVAGREAMTAALRIADLRRVMRRLPRDEGVSSRIRAAQRQVQASYWIAGVNMSIQTVALLVALLSLSYDRDWLPRLVAVAAEFVGFVLLVLGGTAAVVAAGSVDWVRAHLAGRMAKPRPEQPDHDQVRS